MNHPDLDIKIKMMAPSKLFELENYDDPLMFVNLGNNYYYLIHKWGNDMSFFRKILFDLKEVSIIRLSFSRVQ